LWASAIQSSGGLPDTNRLVGAPRCDRFAVGREGDRHHGEWMAGQPAQLLSGGQVPEAEEAVRAGRRGESPAVRSEGHGGDPALVLGEVLDLPRGHIHRHQSAVEAADGESPAVGRKSDGTNDSSPLPESGEFLARGYIPQPHSLVEATGSEGPSIR